MNINKSNDTNTCCQIGYLAVSLDWVEPLIFDQKLINGLLFWQNTDNSFFLEMGIDFESVNVEQAQMESEH